MPRYRHRVEIAQEGIGRGIFLDGSNVRQILDPIMTEARGVMMYQRQRQRTGEIDG